MNFYECLTKGYVPPAAYYKSDVLKMLNINVDTWQKLYKNAKKMIGQKNVFLTDQLKETGYTEKSRQLTKVQCEIIFEFIGYPDLNKENRQFIIQKKFVSEEDIENADIYSK